MTSNIYKYYLANGACVEYAYSPSSNLLELIDQLATAYFRNSVRKYIYYSDRIYVRPEIFRNILVLLGQRSGIVFEGDRPIGWQCISLETTVGSLQVIPHVPLDWPIFIGSEQELKDNSFNLSMEKILCE